MLMHPVCVISELGYGSQKQYTGNINGMCVLPLYVRQSVTSAYMQSFIIHKETIEKICLAYVEKI